MESRTPPPEQHCRTCRHYTYQRQRVAGEREMRAHCAKWLMCFPDATRCRDYEREPGSDDE